MDSFLKASAYLGVGCVVFVVLWRMFDIKWEAESWGIKALMIACIPLWPVVLLFIIGVWVKGFWD